MPANGHQAQNGQGNQGNGQGQGRAGDTDILNLSLGPVDLNLLGLDVQLDDCEGGPVTVASWSPTNILISVRTPKSFE